MLVERWPYQNANTATPEPVRVGLMTPRSPRRSNTAHSAVRQGGRIRFAPNVATTWAARWSSPSRNEQTPREVFAYLFSCGPSIGALGSQRVGPFRRDSADWSISRAGIRDWGIRDRGIIQAVGSQAAGSQLAGFPLARGITRFEQNSFPISRARGPTGGHGSATGRVAAGGAPSV
jgi:hypothetical protein